MTVLALVDSPEAAAAARREHPRAILATDNPLLAARAPGELANLDAALAQERAFALGRLAVAATLAIESRAEQPDIAGRYGLPAGALGLAGPYSRLIASLLHRGAVLALALKAHGPDRVVLRLVDMPRWEPTQPLILPRFAHPARPLAEGGFFGGRPWDFAAVATALPDKVNDTSIRDFGRRAALVPLPCLLFEAAYRLGLGRSRGARLAIGQENEALREALPWLVARGHAVRRVGSLVQGAPADRRGFDQPAPIDPDLAAACGPPLRDALAEVPEFDEAQRNALVHVALLHLDAGLQHLGRRRAELEARVAKAFPRGGMLLTNGFFGPAGAILHRACRERGVRVVEFEHGVTAGLAALTEAKLEKGGPPPVEALFCCAPRAARAFNAAARQGNAPARPIGLADQVRRVLRRPVQRRLARRALGLGAETVVMHVSTLPYFGNHRPGWGSPTETATFDIDRTLIERVYAGLPHRVLFKQYPTQRFPYEPSYAEAFRLAGNLSIRKDEDFRYIRAAADVIVTQTPTSTLGWCVGAGVPLIWLDSRRINPLEDDALRADFAAALLVVDIDRADWPERLRALLDRPLPAIAAAWNEPPRRAARERLYADAITGPAGSTGRRAAGDIAAMLRRSPAPAPMARADAREVR